MFEKEAEEKSVLYVDKLAKERDFEKGTSYTVGLEEGYNDGFKEGAEFGYCKSNEWHYPSKGEYEYPKEYEDILICFLTEDGMKDCVRGWYEYDSENDKHIFKYLNVLGTQYLKTVIAWKEIVFPKLPKEVDK